MHLPCSPQRSPRRLRLAAGAFAVACSYPTQQELKDEMAKSLPDGEQPSDERASIINGQLTLPQMLLRSEDAGRALFPRLLGAATEQHAGQWFMGLQGLRESPVSSIESLCSRRWRMWQQSHAKYLLKSVRALRNHKDREKHAKLLNEWLAVNDYCDWVQQNFVELFTAEVRDPSAQGLALLGRLMTRVSSHEP